MKITQARWQGDLQAPAIQFEINGRAARAHLYNQKLAILDQGFVFVTFPDGEPSELPDVTIAGEDNPAQIVSREFIASSWLAKQILRAADALEDDIWRAGEVIGDGPDE
jgi:hypothetical protein